MFSDSAMPYDDPSRADGKLERITEGEEWESGLTALFS